MVNLEPDGCEDERQWESVYLSSQGREGEGYGQQEEIVPKDEIDCVEFPDTSSPAHALDNSAVKTVAALYHAFQTALVICEKPLRWLLPILIAIAAVMQAKYYGLLQPDQLCHLPVLSNYLPYCPPTNVFRPDFRKLVLLQSHLHGTMEKSTGALMVAVDLKRSEVAVRDLATLVRLSSLPSKDPLVKRLKIFADDAKDTGRSLQKFGSHVGRTVDEIVAMNEYTLETLGSAVRDIQPGLSVSFISSLSASGQAARSKQIKDAWFEATGLIKTRIQELTLEAVANKRALDELENQLSVIHGMITRAKNTLNVEKTEELSGLWNSLRKDQAKIEHFESHAQLLKDLYQYRKEAATHVTDTLFQLERIALDLQELNDKAAAPLLALESESPLEAHIRAMQKGTERLLETRAREREREDQYMRSVLQSNSALPGLEANF